MWECVQPTIGELRRADGLDRLDCAGYNILPVFRLSQFVPECTAHRLRQAGPRQAGVLFRSLGLLLLSEGFAQCQDQKRLPHAGPQYLLCPAVYTVAGCCPSVYYLGPAPPCVGRMLLCSSSGGRADVQFGCASPRRPTGHKHVQHAATLYLAPLCYGRPAGGVGLFQGVVLEGQALVLLQQRLVPLLQVEDLGAIMVLKLDLLQQEAP